MLTINNLANSRLDPAAALAAVRVASRPPVCHTSYRGEMAFLVEELIWDTWNRGHIWQRHRVTREKVESACFGGSASLVRRARRGEAGDEGYQALARTLGADILRSTSLQEGWVVSTWSQRVT